jgi:pimeloyl-ACP methyl ester carboxylesterase
VIHRLRSSAEGRYYRDLANFWRRSIVMLSRGGIVLLLPLLALAGCNAAVARALIKAPNRDLAQRGQDAPASVLGEHHVSRQFRVNVGPPPASLQVWIIDPIDGHGTLSIGPDDHGQPVVRLMLRPRTASTVASAAADPPKTPRATLFMLNGLGDDMESPPYEFYSLLMACQGYRVIMVDLRGHGRSTGDHITYGARESLDLVQVLDAVEARGLVAGQVGVIGVSYGGSMAICWAAIDPRVKAVVALEPFSSLSEAANDAGPQLLGNASWMFGPGDFQKIAVIMGHLEGFDPVKDSPLAAIARCRTPVLIFHGKADTFLRPAHSIRLHEAAMDHSQLILVDGATHFDLWLKGLPMIPRESDAWFQRYLEEQPLPAPESSSRPFAPPPSERLGLSP